MKIRVDFVTNSSSSSFIIAKKKGLSEKQKEIIIDYVEKNMFGKKIASTKEELDDYYKEYYNVDPNEEDFKNTYKHEDYEKELEAIEKGLDIYSGYVDFEECDYSYASMFADLWKKLSEEDKNGDFVEIDTSLDY